jgi:hypothetical protein
MRTLKHPITVFTLMVLMVIGIGVGVLAATTNQKVYGPTWGRFTAAFSGHIYEQRGRTSMDFAAIASFPFRRQSGPFPVFSYSNVLSGYWVGTLPYATESVTAIRGLPMQPVVAFTKRGFPRAGLIEVKQDANGFSVVTFGPQCSVICMGTKIVSKGHVLWTVVAVSSGSASSVENFLNSFQPIG